MKLDTYQKRARKMAVYEDNDYPLLGLVEEVGELVGKYAKCKRGDYEFTDEVAEAMMLELGDCLWMLQEVAGILGFRLSEVAQANLDKLESRKNRNVLKGEGDNR